MEISYTLGPDPGHRIRKTHVLLLILASLSVSACDQDPQLSAGAQVVISPPQRQFEIQERLDDNGDCQFSEQYYQDSPIHILVLAESGSAIGGVDASIFTDYAANTYPGFPALALYDDHNGNGRIDHPLELVTAIDDAIYTFRTDDYSGTKSLLLRINLSCAYNGSLHVFSGPVYQSMEISVANVNRVQ